MRADSARDTTDRSPQPGRLHVQSGGQQVMRRGRLIAADNPSFGDMSTPMGGMLTIMTGDNDPHFQSHCTSSRAGGRPTADSYAVCWKSLPPIAPTGVG